MDLTDVLNRFALISGITSEKSIFWSSVCRDSINEVTLRIKSGVDTNLDKNKRRLVNAAACLSFYKYAVYKSYDANSASDASTASQKQAYMKNAYQIWSEAEASVSDLLNDNRFVFERVEI